MQIFTITSPQGTMVSLIDDLYTDLLDVQVSPDYHNKKQIVRLYKIKFNGYVQTTELNDLAINLADVIAILTTLSRVQLLAVFEDTNMNYNKDISLEENQIALANKINENKWENIAS